MRPLATKPLRNAGLFIGIGMGGFIDGILFHQILQIHNMLSNRFYPDTLVNAELNMFWDGIFHLFTWFMTAIGIFLLWRASKQDNVLWTSRYLAGSIALGWGLFNLVEGVIDHHLLQIHHVVERAVGSEQLTWDLLFDASGVALIIIGLLMMRQSRQ